MKMMSRMHILLAREQGKMEKKPHPELFNLPWIGTESPIQWLGYVLIPCTRHPLWVAMARCHFAYCRLHPKWWKGFWYGAPPDQEQWLSPPHHHHSLQFYGCHCWQKIPKRQQGKWLSATSVRSRSTWAPPLVAETRLKAAATPANKCWQSSEFLATIFEI